MSDPLEAEQYRNRLLTLIGVLVGIAALRESYSVTMPILFAGVIVAALWPLKLYLQQWLPTWLSSFLAILTMITVMGGFAVAVYLSLGQIVGVVADHWPMIERTYASALRLAGRLGFPLSVGIDRNRILAAVGMLGSSIYAFTTYVGFIGILVMLGLPEVPRFYEKLRTDLSWDEQRELRATLVAISEQIRSYFGVTLATSMLTGVASTLWALAMGLDLALVWGLLNFILNFIPVIGNIIGIVPPVLYAVMQFGNVGVPLVILIGYIILQVGISNFVYPILQGRQLSLSPFAIIIAMTF
ncbi:AI-2E family transporter [Sphingobium sp. BS19]|uniref:AI-2E family transporter n=1 Tax=Sphingobium sp. BS19 TaxID=3018973 RepID=UPI0022EF392D|nr:AI-2E family transporter [Sphingobium sp. BS19]GLI98990.1 hypothetical protein Sbs19_28080 [Sphingobium sp. BS19]